MTIRLMIISLFFLTSLQGFAQEFRFPNVDSISGMKMWHFPGAGVCGSMKRIQPTLLRQRYRPFITLHPGSSYSFKSRFYKLLRLEDFHATYAFNPITEDTDFLVDLYLKDGRIVTFLTNEKGDFVTADGRFLNPYAGQVINNLKTMRVPKGEPSAYRLRRVEDENHPSNFLDKARAVEVLYLWGKRFNPTVFYRRPFEGLQLDMFHRGFFRNHFYHWMDVNAYQKNEEANELYGPKVAIRFVLYDGSSRYIFSDDFQTFVTQDGQFQITYPPETTQYFKDLLSADS